MKVLVSGASGLVGRYIVNGLLRAGYGVVAGGRNPPAPNLFKDSVGFVPLLLDPDQDQQRAFEDVDFFVHAAFDHLPGRYRGGEGNDPDGFRSRNLDGSVALFEAARQAGVQRVVFLSSRAVYDGLPPGTRLHEDLPLAPDSLYGQIKLDGERALAHLAGPGFATASLRLTGVYGDLRPNKWDQLFANCLAGKPISPRVGSEVHGEDVAAGVRLMLETEPTRISGQSFNLSDLVVDTRDILAALGAPARSLPPEAPGHQLNIMATGKIEALGWRPGGKALFARTTAAYTASLSATT